MTAFFGGNPDPERAAREAIRRRKWGKAIAHYEKKLQAGERDFALWNLLGDLHMNNRARDKAVEAWRRALDGYALEGLHENVLGIARKVLRRLPEEEDIYLLIAEAYLGLEYHADCLAALRSYIKLSKRRSEADLRSLFRKILESGICHLHLLEELKAVYRETGIEDYELEERLNAFVATREPVARPAEPATEPESAAAPVTPAQRRAAPASEGLIGLDGMATMAEDDPFYGGLSPSLPAASAAPPAFEADFETPDDGALAALPEGEGKDHYDLGMVYKEMKLWDAAIAEFEQARRDGSMRGRATLELCECLQETNDLQGALNLLERERLNGESSLTEKMNVELQLGAIHELLGNLDDALAHFEAVHARNPNFGGVETRIAELKDRLESDSAR